MSYCYIAVDDLTDLWRPLSEAEKARANALIPVVCDSLRMEAQKVGKDLDAMLVHGEVFEQVVRSVCVDVVARALMTSTNAEPTVQYSQAGLGYSVSGTYLVPGGGLWVKKSELARLGLRRQRLGVVDLCSEA